MSRGLAIAVACCAVALTGVDMAKPLVIDDAAYHQFASHIAAHPGDPYGFEVFWYAAPQPANTVLAPPVFLYWWAAGLHLLGDHPLLWKLWMFPFALLLTTALALLLRRFAPAVAIPMLCAISLSPPILPALNLMLDLPALALSLCALALALRACDEDRLSLALFAGLVAGLALETKYTAVVPFVAALGHACLMRRLRLAAVMSAVAAAIFCGWELWTLRSYGSSHFLEGLRQVGEIDSLPPLHWGGALLSLLGSAAVGIGVLALLGSGRSRGSVVAASVLATLGLLGVAALPGAPLGGGQAMFPAWQAELWIFLPLGAFVLGALGQLAWREARHARHATDPAQRSLDRFLLLWLAVEFAGFFFVSPFPALRRLIGLYVASGFLVARALERSAGADARPLLKPLVIWSSALGLLFAVSDISDARVRVDVLDRAVARLDAEPSLAADGTRWYVGHWGFQFYAERHGLRPIVPGVSRLLPGDAVVAPLGVYQQRLRVPRTSVVAIDEVRGTNPWPWSTLPWAYSGYPPLRAQPELQISIQLGRVVELTIAR